jgi:hypothetical protein
MATPCHTPMPSDASFSSPPIGGVVCPNMMVEQIVPLLIVPVAMDRFPGSFDSRWLRCPQFSIYRVCHPVGDGQFFYNSFLESLENFEGIL